MEILYFIHHSLIDRIQSNEEDYITIVLKSGELYYLNNISFTTSIDGIHGEFFKYK